MPRHPRRRYRPTLEHRRRGDAHKRGYGSIPFYEPLIAAATGAPVVGAGRWRETHGRKSALLFCEALRLRKSLVHDLAGQPLAVYPCEEGPAPGAGGPRHWHVGHRSARYANT